MTFRPRLRWRPGDTVWTPRVHERHDLVECPSCMGRGWHERENGYRWTCVAGGCQHGRVRKPLRSYEVPVSGVVVVVTIDSDLDVIYDVDTIGGRAVRGEAEMFFATEADCEADIRARGFALEQREQR